MHTLNFIESILLGSHSQFYAGIQLIKYFSGTAFPGRKYKKTNNAVLGEVHMLMSLSVEMLPYPNSNHQRPISSAFINTQLSENNNLFSKDGLCRPK
jgi:hypothetical protein